MNGSLLDRASVAERVTISVGGLCYTLHDVTVVVHRVVQAVDLWRGDRHVVTSPLGSTVIEWELQEDWTELQVLEAVG
jgi:hypothetical protein